MTGIAQTSSSGVPADIVAALRGLIRRARVVIVLRGLCAVAAVALGSLLAAMAVDAGATLFASWPRWALSLSALALTLLAAAWFLLRPLLRTYTLTGVARAIEVRHPELQERVSSAVQLLASKDRREFRGSEALIAALAGEACRDARGVRPGKEVTLRPVRPFLVAACVLGAAMVAVFAVWPRQASHVWARVVAPYQDRPNVFGYQLSVTPGDAVLAAGDVLEVEVEVANQAVTSARFLRPGPGGRDAAVDMTPLPARQAGQARFAFTCPPAAESFRYRVHAGDALSRYYEVTVVPRPAVDRFHVAYDFPAYTVRPRDVRPEGEGDIHAVAGTTVTITAQTNTSVNAAQLRINDLPPIDGEVLPSDGRSVCRFQFVLAKKHQGRWSIHLQKTASGHPFSGQSEGFSIEAAPDSPPVVQITRPDSATLRVKPTDRLPIAFVAGDDFGLGRAELLVDVDGRSRPPVALPLPSDANGPVRAFFGRTFLNLADLDLQAARQVSFRIRVLDNLPAELEGPQEAFSAACTAYMDVAAIPYLRQMSLAEELALREVLLLVLTECQGAKKDSAPLRKVLQSIADANAAEEALSPPNAQRVERITTHLATADAAIREVLPTLTSGEFPTMAEKLTTLANDHVARAHDLAAQVALTDKALQRAELSDEADFQIDRAIALVSDLLKELQVLGLMAQQAEEAADLARRQEELAAQRQEMLNPQADPSRQAGATSAPTSGPSSAPSAGSQPAGAAQDQASPPPTLEEWKNQQQDVANRLAQMVRQSNKAMQQQMNRSQEQTKDLSADARRLAAQQTALAGVTRRAGEVAQLNKDIQAMATAQAALADRTAKQAPDQAPPTMAAAAEALKAGRNQDALAKQQEAADSLAAKADALTREARTGELARRVEQIAQKQEALAKEANQAKADAESSAVKVRSATTQAAQAARKHHEAQGTLATELAALRRRQQELAGRAADIEKHSAAPKPPTSAPASQPSEAMSAAAKNMKPDQLPKALAGAKDASRLAHRDASARAAATQPAPRPPASAPASGPASRAASPPSPEAVAQAARANKLAQQAAQVAAEQNKIESDLAALAAKAAQVEQAANQSKQAQAEQVRQVKADADAAEKLASLSKPQQDLRQQLAEAAKAAPSVTPAAREALAKNNPAPAMEQAAKAMRAKTPAPAAAKADEAAKTARQLAQALAHGRPPTTQPAADDARRLALAGKLAELAKAQAALRAQAAAKAQQAKAAADALRSEQWDLLKKEQAQVASQAAALSDRVKSVAPQEDRLDTKAARAAEDAAEQFASAADTPARAKAARASDHAGDTLGNLARRLGADLPPPDANHAASTRSAPPPRPAPPATEEGRRAALTQDAQALAQRQQTIARQAMALAEGRVLDAIRPPQEQIAAKTSDLADDVSLVRTFADQLIPDRAARQEANQAADSLERSLRAQQKAQESLASRTASAAQTQQKDSADALSAAADALDRLGQKMADLARANPAEAPDEQSTQMNDALEAADQAALTQEARDAAMAAKLLARLAAQMAQQAQAMGVTLPSQENQQDQEGPPSEQSMGLRGARLMQVELLTGTLRAAGLTLADWEKLPGELRDEILQGAADEGPEEYRSLIKRYFEEIARRGAEKKENRK